MGPLYVLFVDSFVYVSGVASPLLRVDWHCLALLSLRYVAQLRTL
jgi:hypothetical protein